MSRKSRLVSRLIGYRQSKTTQLASKIITGAERRSLRELQSLLFKLKRQYRTLHKNYSKIHGFAAYAHRNGMYLPRVDATAERAMNLHSESPTLMDPLG